MIKKIPTTLVLLIVVLGCTSLLAFSTPLHHHHDNVRFRRRLSPRWQAPGLQIDWVGSGSQGSSSASTSDSYGGDGSSGTGGSVSEESDMGDEVGNSPTPTPTPFLWAPSLAGPPPSPPTPPSPPISVSATTIETIPKTTTTTTTVYDSEPKTITITASPHTITNTITISEPFTATPGSSWSAPVRFSNLDSFRVAHFASGERNLQITSGVPPDEVDDSNPDSLVAEFSGTESGMGSGTGTGTGAEDTTNMKIFLQDEQTNDWNSSSALQLFYPQDSINPGNSNAPQGGADFYATPLPLSDASNVTLEYSVFFPKDFDWVLGGKLPGLYGGHMTCSGGDDATRCFSTRLMWRAGGAGELYLYAPKDKQTYSLCHAPPESVCNSEYGLSVGRGSFKFTPGAWTHVSQTIALNTPGKQDGGFRLDVNGKSVIHRHDVFYRDVPSVPMTTATSSPATTQTTPPGEDGGSGDGGLLSPLLSGVLGALDKAGINPGILPPFVKNNDSISFITSTLSYPISGEPPLLPLQYLSDSEIPITGDAASAFIYNLTASASRTELVETVLNRPPTVTQIVARPAVTITNYLWEHTFDVAGKEAAVPGVNEGGSGEPKAIGFSGLFFSTFFGGSSEEYATPKDQYTWFKDFAITINS